MNLRNKVLTGVLALQAVVLIGVFWPRSAGPGIEQLIGGLEEPDVVAVTITDGEGKSIHIARSPFGCVLPDAADYPCAKDRLPDFLRRIVPLTTASLVTDTPASHSRLNVAEDNFERIIELDLADETKRKFYLGTSPRGRSGHARIDGRDQVYLAPGLSAFDAPVREDAWVDPLYFSVPQDRVKSVTIENTAGAVTIEREESGDWALSDHESERPIDQSKAASMVRSATSIRLARPLGKEEMESYGLQNSTVVVTVSVGGGDSDSTGQTVRIGGKLNADGGYVAKSSESPYYVIVDETAVQALVDVGPEDLLEAPVEPTPDGSN